MTNRQKNNSGGQQGKPAITERQVIQNIIAAMSDGVLVIDREGRIILHNQALSEILGIAPERFDTSGWAELFFDNPENQEFNQVVVEVIQKKSYHTHKQVPYITPDGVRKELIVTASLLAQRFGGSHEVGGIMVVINDITRMMRLHRREAELLRQSQALAQEKVEGLDRLARSVAHEIRNPVTAIGGLVRRMQAKGHCNPTEAGYLDHILASTKRLEMIVQEVRAYADLPVPRLRPGDLGAWVGQMANLCTDEACRINVDVELAGLAGEPGKVTVRMDEELLEMCVGALVENALEAMPGGGKLTLGLTLGENAAAITVSDTGKGIDPADMPYLFDPFFSTKADAVGMSLAIAKRVALEHRGDLTAQSQPGKGSTFTLTIPLKGHEESEGREHRPPQLK